MQTKSQTLIDRYNLNARIPSVKGKEKEEVVVDTSPAGLGTGGKDGKGEWADTKDKRERELRERKERMILEARR
jgi:coupling of ubiquitin conjugation to ER degradation protein 1